MKKAAIVLAVSAATFLGSYQIALSHCEIPCGIYNDKARIVLIQEHITTVEKSMKQITALSEESPVNYNQLIRWVTNKEEHCSKIQHIVTQYFMTQRVKPAPTGDAATQRKYLKQLTTLHAMLLSAMKSKQTTDTTHTDNLRKQVMEFAEAYFSPEDLEHLKEHHP